MKHEPRIDDYIARAAPFAQPILTHLRAMVHAACPEATEAIKWGMPFFLLDGRPLANMAAFKAHAAFGFWKGSETGKEREAMGQFGRIAAFADLPDDATILSAIREAVAAHRSGVPLRPKKPPRPPLETPPDLAQALAGDGEAEAAFAAFPPGHRREYIEWIEAAKRSETRTKRIATTVDQAREKKSLNWKYQK